MAFNDYIDSDYTVSGYFTGDVAINAVEGNGAFVSVASFTADLSPADMSYIDPTYIEAGYFEGTEAAGGIQEAAATLSSISSFSLIPNKTHSVSAASMSYFDVGAIPFRQVQGNATISSQDTFSIYVQAVREYELMAFTDATMSINAGKLVSGSVVVPGEQDYVDGTYIQGGYFVLGIGVIPVITSTLVAVSGKLQSATTDIIVSGQYVDPTYLEQGYFEGTVLYGVVGAFSVTADLELSETGFINGVAFLTSNFTLTAIPLELTAPQEAYATLLSNVNVSSSVSLVRDNEVDAVSLFNANINATKAYGFSSNLDITSSTSSDAQRTRGYNASFETDVSVSTINSRIRDNNSQMYSEFSQNAYGARQRDIDLFAFSNGQLATQANVIRDSNSLANTFFNVGTDFIRQRNVSAEGEAIVFISNIPTRIRDTNTETQDAFSFASTAVATRNINLSVVSTSNQEPTPGVVIRGAISTQHSDFNFSIIPDIFRNAESNINVSVEQNTIGVATYGGESLINCPSTLLGYGNATLDCDMIAFNQGGMTTKGNARFRANSEMFCIPGFNMVVNNVRLRFVQSNQSLISTSVIQAVKIHPFVANTFSCLMTTNIIGGRINPLYANLIEYASIEATGVVRFYFFPTNFSISVLDEPLANTFFSRTRETGVNI